jgi:ABC-type uncharacterized transport system substrate-binding protein
MFMTRLVPLLAMLAVGSPAAAHPHIFVDVSHTLLFDNAGRLIGLRARWEYDEMFTLLMVEDGQYDVNGDGAVAGAELEKFQRWDADWPQDYAGDIEITFGDAPVALDGPSDWAAEWENGRATSIHTRLLKTPLVVNDEALTIRPYDPDFYVDYSVTEQPKFAGRDDCKAQIWEPDPEAIPQQLADAVAELSASMTPEEAGLPAVGKLYSESEEIKCDG